MSNSETQSADHLHAMRHSLAHILATAIQELHPGAKFGVGPVVENGFYYDVEVEPALTLEDLPKLEAKMAEIIKANYPFERSTMKLDEAIEHFTKAKQPYKVELLKDLQQHGTTVAKDIDRDQLGSDSEGKVDEVLIYTDGPFMDLCRGPHVESTGKVGAFKLMRISGAYWRGDEKNAQLQRIYGVGFPDRKQLAVYLERLAEAEKRDHRKLGQELDLFVFSDLVGPGLPLWTPRGTVLREELDRFVQDLRKPYGFQAVAIPHVTKKDLYEKSGHWSKFEDELFKVKTRDGHELAMKPMNCPHHTQIYASRPRSYRDLPIRYRETTMVYRDEQSGELSGLSRVRSITQDDAHVFCRQSDIESEIKNIWDIVERFYGAFGIELQVRLSSHDPQDMSKYLGDVKKWDEAVSQLRAVIESKGVKYIDGVGEAAFYGPKIDFMGKDVLGREFQASTIQLDFGQPEGFDLTCTNESGEDERIVMIHCAIAGSLERCLVLLIEHYAGAFPVWLSPEQVRVALVNDSKEIADWAHDVANQMRTAGLRVELDDTNESVGKKIRAAELSKVPYTLVIGEKEVESGEVSARSRKDLAELKPMKLAEFIGHVQEQSNTRKN